MTIEALHEAGGVAYLRAQAHKNPAAFLALIGKCIPLQIKADVNNLEIVVHRLEINAQPVPGVIGSPVRGHVPQLVHDAERKDAAP